MNVDRLKETHRAQRQEMAEKLEMLASRLYRDEPAEDTELGSESFELLGLSRELGLLTVDAARLAGEYQVLRIATEET